MPIRRNYAKEKGREKNRYKGVIPEHMVSAMSSHSSPSLMLQAPVCTCLDEGLRVGHMALGPMASWGLKSRSEAFFLKSSVHLLQIVQPCGGSWSHAPGSPSEMSCEIRCPQEHRSQEGTVATSVCALAPPFL